MNENFGELLEKFKFLLEEYKKRQFARLDSLKDAVRRKHLEDMGQIWKSGLEKALTSYESEMKKVQQMRAEGMNEFLIEQCEKAVNDQFEITAEFYKKQLAELK